MLISPSQDVMYETATTILNNSRGIRKSDLFRIDLPSKEVEASLSLLIKEGVITYHPYPAGGEAPDDGDITVDTVQMQAFLGIEED
mgnify:CR=1 FL=1